MSHEEWMDKGEQMIAETKIIRKEGEALFFGLMEKYPPYNNERNGMIVMSCFQFAIAKLALSIDEDPKKFMDSFSDRVLLVVGCINAMNKK